MFFSGILKKLPLQNLFAYGRHQRYDLSVVVTLSFISFSLFIGHTYFCPTIQKLIKSVAWMLYISGVHLSRSPLTKIKKYKGNWDCLLNFFFFLDNLKIVEGGKYIFI